MCSCCFDNNAVNSASPSQVFVPCGYCDECRERSRRHWSFRLRADLESKVKKGWKVGFFTLTYSDENIPRLPPSVCSEPLMCFSRKDCVTFIQSLRKELWRSHGIAGVSYMICTEFGKSTQRSHMHGCIAWPFSPHTRKRYNRKRKEYEDVVYPPLDPEVMHSLILRLWTKGFVFPRHYLGGRDSKGFLHNSFEVDCVGSAVKYTAKYACKDLDFFKSLSTHRVDVDSELFRKECDSFHLQSRGLGFSAIADLSDADKLDLLIDGYSFVGEDRLHPLPLYFRNKLLFDNYYVYDIRTHERLVRREANDFFSRYKQQIYDKKKEFYKSMFDNILDANFITTRYYDFWHNEYKEDYLNSGMLNYDLQLFNDCMSKVRSCFSSDFLATYYMSFFAVPQAKRYCNPLDAWFARYTQFNDYDSDLKSEVENYDWLIAKIFTFLGYIRKPTAPNADLVAFVTDFFKHLE